MESNCSSKPALLHVREVVDLERRQVPRTSIVVIRASHPPSRLARVAPLSHAVPQVSNGPWFLEEPYPHEQNALRKYSWLPCVLSRVHLH